MAHADAHPTSRRVGDTIRRAGESGLLTDTNVTDSTTLASLKAKVTANAAHADLQPAKAVINEGLDLGGESGDLTTTIITNATGVANLATNTLYDRGRTYGSLVD